MSKQAAVGSRIGGGWAPVLVAFVFLVALNLRPAITSVGPVLPQIGVDVGINEGAQGLLGALPVFAFGAVSLFVHRISRKLGIERSIFLALLMLAAGVLIRSYLGLTGLWLGTIVLGLAIGIGNVLVPVIVRRDFPSNVSRATGLFSACITISASVGAALSVPIAEAFTWRESLSFWAIPAVIVALLWLPRTRPNYELRVTPIASSTVHISVWRQPTAWLLTVFMGLQSTTFYVIVTWLPTIQMVAGSTEQEAGMHLFAYQIVGIASALGIPVLMRRGADQRLAGLVSTVPMLVAALGFLFAPSLGLLWAVIAGLSSGSSLVVALTLISLRGRTHEEATQLSGMAQSLGYMLAAVGPLAAGALAEWTGAWSASLALLVAMSVVLVIAAYLAGKDRHEAATPSHSQA